MKTSSSSAESAPPSGETGAATEPTSEAIEQIIQAAVAAGFMDLREELAPARRFVNPVESENFRVPATVKRYSSLKHFAGKGADERAYRFGMFCLGVYGKRQGIDFCLKQGIPLISASDSGAELSAKTQRENVNVSSGFLVPDEFQNDLIDLREKFGVFRQNAKVVPMASDSGFDSLSGCSGCDADSTDPGWDGTLNHIGAGCVWWAADEDFDPLSINGVMLDITYTQLLLRTSEPCQWELYIACGSTTNPTQTMWSGYKLGGSTPAGTYTFMSSDCGGSGTMTVS